jgi:hypothetical protein
MLALTFAIRPRPKKCRNNHILHDKNSRLMLHKKSRRQYWRCLICHCENARRARLRKLVKLDILKVDQGRLVRTIQHGNKGKKRTSRFFGKNQRIGPTKLVT